MLNASSSVENVACCLYLLALVLLSSQLIQYLEVDNSCLIIAKSSFVFDLIIVVWVFSPLACLIFFVALEFDGRS
jgi:hypothetical protein